jgi:hypothetical protein
MQIEKKELLIFEVGGTLLFKELSVICIAFGVMRISSR